MKGFTQCQKDFIKELSGSFSKNELVLFCGAGVPKYKPVGLPLWDELLARLTYRALKDDGIDILEVLAKHSTRLSPAELLYPPSPLHASVLRLTSAAVFRDLKEPIPGDLPDD